MGPGTEIVWGTTVLKPPDSLWLFFLGEAGCLAVRAARQAFLVVCGGCSLAAAGGCFARRYSCCSARALRVDLVVVYRSLLSPRHVVPDQGSSPCLLHWQADRTTEPPGSPQVLDLWPPECDERFEVWW